MIRVSKSKIMFVSINKFNVGQPSHYLVHKINKIPWTHGDRSLMSPFKVKKIFKEKGLLPHIGVVDCPCWPDSLGFRDKKIHSIDKDLTKLDWKPNIVQYLKNGFPKWMKFVYLFEKLPLPTILKLPYAHLFYVIGDK